MNDAALVIAGQLEAAGAPCITCSFQAEDVVVLHMLRSIAPDIPVLFLDTVHHFAETYAYRDELAERWGLNLVNLRATEPSPGLWQTSTDACCARHKVEPLFRPSRPMTSGLQGCGANSLQAARTWRISNRFGYPRVG